MPAPSLEEAVAATAHEALAALRGAAAPTAPLRLELALTLHPGERWRAEAEPSLAEQVRRAVREAAARREALRPGRVWCYRCESTGCEHARPPAPDRVFGGYGATGLPQWPSLAEVLLARRHPQVGTLFGAAGGGLAAAFVPGADLCGRQLEVFGRGSKTYAVLCQAVFGLLALRVPGRDGAEADRVAFTLQAVETRTARGAPRLDLNVIALLSDGSPAVEALEGPAGLRVLNTVSVARRLLRHAAHAPDGHRRPDRAPDLEARAAAVLRGAVRALERLGRQCARRTRHAETRGHERRPVASAREDALAAPAEAILRDERRGTVVVLGPHHRVHVFSPEGRHITSLVLEAAAVRRRRRLERWEPLEAGALRDFREGLARGPGGADYSPSPTRSST